MANELKVTIQGVLANGNHAETFNPGSISIDQAAQGGYAAVVSVGTAEENLAVGDVGTVGWLFLRNLDTANYVTWGPNNAGSMVAIGRLEAGETAAFRMEPSTTLRWQANTAACKVKVLLLED